MTVAKKVWGNSLTIKESADIMIEWCINARERNIIAKKPSRLIHAYVLEDTPPLNFFEPVSSMFRYSNKDVPYTDKIRDNLLRCLAVALKAHFFLFNEDRVEHEPFFYVYPSLENSNEVNIGLIYKLEKSKKTIIVSEKDLQLLSQNNNILYDFNVALTHDSFKWYHMKNWGRLRAEHVNASPWIEDELLKKAKQAKTKEELEELATIIDVPFYLKDYLKPLGADWAKHLKTWFVPKGYDFDSILEYKEYLLRTIPKPEEKNTKK